MEKRKSEKALEKQELIILSVEKLANLYQKLTRTIEEHCWNRIKIRKMRQRGPLSTLPPPISGIENEYST